MTNEARTLVMTGGCQCGAVRYAMYAAPKAGICHCRMCQRAVGGPFFAWAMVGTADFAWTHGQPAWFRSSSIARRSFCAECGTPLAFQYDSKPDHIDLSIGSLDTPEAVRPAVSLGEESRLSWCDASLFALPAHVTGALNPPGFLEGMTSNQAASRG
jgi:hypothetical protein